MNRGDGPEAIFADDLDRHRFLETLAEVCTENWPPVLVYCLMPNHFDLVFETPQANLVWASSVSGALIPAAATGDDAAGLKMVSRGYSRQGAKTANMPRHADPEDMLSQEADMPIPLTDREDRNGTRRISEMYL